MQFYASFCVRMCFIQGVVFWVAHFYPEADYSVVCAFIANTPMLCIFFLTLQSCVCFLHQHYCVVCVFFNVLFTACPTIFYDESCLYPKQNVNIIGKVKSSFNKTGCVKNVQKCCNAS